MSQKRRPDIQIPTTKMPQTSFSFPLSGLSGLKTPELFLNLMRQDPTVNTNSAAIFKSPDWTLSIHTPELTSILGLSTGPTSALFPGFEGPTSAGGSSVGGGGAQRAMERNPFSESFTAVSSGKSPAQASSTSSAGIKQGSDAVPPLIEGSGNGSETPSSMSESEHSTGSSSMQQRSLPGLVEVAAAAAAAESKKTPGKRGRKRNATEPTDDPVEEKRRRRRERNRVAAANCRQRKIDKENTLREELKQLHSQHGELFDTMVALQKELVLLKQEAVKHMEAGCVGFDA